MAGNPTKRRKMSGTIKINGRGNVVVYLVRQAAPKNPAAPTPAEDISTEKLTFTPLSLFKKVSVQESTKKMTKKKAKIEIGARSAKKTSKKLVANTNKSVQISASKKYTAKIQRKSATVKIAARKAAVQKKTTKKIFLNKITAKPALRMANSKSLAKIKEDNVQKPLQIGTENDETTKSPTTHIVKSNISSP
jgi:hypothetical protein